MVAKVTTISIYTTHTVLGLLFYVSCGVEIIVFITVRYQKFYLFVRCIFTTRFRIEPPISNYLTSSAVWSEFEVRTVALTSTSFFGFKLLVRSVSKKVVYNLFSIWIVPTIRIRKTRPGVRIRTVWSYNRLFALFALRTSCFSDCRPYKMQH